MGRLIAVVNVESSCDGPALLPIVYTEGDDAGSMIVFDSITELKKTIAEHVLSAHDWVIYDLEHAYAFTLHGPAVLEEMEKP